MLPLNNSRISLLFFAFLGVAVCLILMAGCASAPPSDIPWNAPQSWEGTTVLPGMEGR
jgi:hypothetical protein